MKDIKHLYLTAKTSGNPKDITAYTECVQELLESKPYDYISNLEYIISSSIGLKTWNEFVDRYGLPIACYDDAMECFEKCIHKCETTNGDSSLYKEAVSGLERFHERYKNCFMMFESFKDSLSDKYVKTYYGFTENNTQNRKLLHGMVKEFNESAVPDILVTAHSLGGPTNNDAVIQCLKYFEKHETLNSPTFCQWIVECSKDVLRSVDGNKLAIMIDNSLERIVENVSVRNTSCFREAAIMGDSNAMLEYTEEELTAIQNLIAFREYQLTFAETFEEAKSIQDEIYSLYEEFDGLIGEDGSLMEAPWMLNAGHKKTGSIPTYLGRNHNMNWGEEDDDKSGSSSDRDEPTLDTYRRKSIDNDDDSSIHKTGRDIIDDDPGEDIDIPNKKDVASTGGNYYYTYYTYNDSFNKNNNSFNRSHSSVDDHSTAKGDNRGNTDSSTGKGDNRGNSDSSTNKGDGTRTHDDHSTSKGDNRGNTDSSTSKGDNRGNTKTHNTYGKESVFNPCELDVPGNQKVFAEGIKDIFKKVINKIKGLIGIKKSLANLQNLDIPSVSTRKIPVTIVGTNIPINMNNNHKTESVDNVSTTSDLHYLLEHGYVITEDVSDQFLSKNDIKNVVNNLRSKFKAEILFVSSNGNHEILSQLGPAAVIKTDRDAINKLTSGKSIDRIKSPLYGDVGNFDTVILVNSKLMRDFNVKTPRDLELIISHEYGHVLTYDQLTLDDWLEYTIKRQTMTSLVQGLYFSGGLIEATAEMNLFYYKLKPEALANKAANINPVELIKILFRHNPVGKLDRVDLDVIVNWKIPTVVMDISRASAKGNNNINNADMLASIDASIKLYESCIKDSDFLEAVIAALKSTKDTYLELNESTIFSEAVGDSDNNKPTSDIQDILTDVDRGLIKGQQAAKKTIQNVQNTGRIFMKPAVRTSQWIGKMVADWKDADETRIKEKLTNPHERKNLFNAIGTAIKCGSLLKAHLLFNPVFLFLTTVRAVTNNKKLLRIKNEVIHEIKLNIEVLKAKIEDADKKGDLKAKYQLMRLRGELEKKLLRVGGTKDWKKII